MNILEAKGTQASFNLSEIATLIKQDLYQSAAPVSELVRVRGDVLVASGREKKQGSP